MKEGKLKVILNLDTVARERVLDSIYGEYRTIVQLHEKAKKELKESFKEDSEDMSYEEYIDNYGTEYSEYIEGFDCRLHKSEDNIKWLVEGIEVSKVQTYGNTEFEAEKELKEEMYNIYSKNIASIEEGKVKAILLTSFKEYIDHVYINSYDVTKTHELYNKMIEKIDDILEDNDN